MKAISWFVLAALILGAALHDGSAVAAPAGAVAVNLDCNILAPGIDANGNSTPTECTNGGFPYTVPAGQQLCITHAFFVNKYPFNPLRYNGTGATAQGYTGDMHTMYFEMYGFSLAAHHPEVTFYPPMSYPAGSQFRAWFDNGMLEAQYVYGIAQGFTVASTASCL